MKTEVATGACPRCNGTLRRPYPLDHDPTGRYKPVTFGYDAATDTLPCNNCGGQTMAGRATGRVPLRADGSPCLHEFRGRAAGRCYTEYTCKHCREHYAIDSGD